MDHLTKQPPSGLVAIDGFDGAGKTTLALKISRHCDMPYLDLDSILIGPKKLNYVDRIDYERLSSEVAAQKTGLIVSGVFVQRILLKIEAMPSIKIYVKRISSNGLWHQGWDIDSESFDENQMLDGRMRRYSDLSVDILKYHREFTPHTNSDLYYNRTED
ncbi:MAG: hypothetical protein WCC66_16675 [Rhizobiaceae bacterium]